MAPSIALILLAGLAEVIGFALVSSMKEGIRNPRGSLADFASFAGDLNEVAQLEGLRDIVAALLAICGVGLLIRALVLRRRARHRYAERAGRP
jgi:hypothetical protein